MKQAASRTVDARLPFLGELFDLVEMRECADNLRARLLEPHGHDDFRLADEMRTFIAGASERIVVNKFERDAAVRRACIERWGCARYVCKVDLSERYGREAAGFIHVHHLRPLAARAGEHHVDPTKDLRPVCPNCHAVMHLADPPHTPERVQSMLRRAVAPRGRSGAAR